ncbi:BglG family transcription antiterminator [Vibrio sp. S11_S32]|uniref:BglG family transcription antiterminator n=1 Tax=Vibrio sp. S11_S32 TaxID=2720225 RepID=UPI001680344D|nr:PRD domain-containing protein [Vibrio sp. S11_S32]MBD1576502.1 BglG family transcription antiterminator [Vibrio sp. S11_S32]
MIQLAYPRLNIIFEALREQILPQQELAHRCQVSTRTIRTDVSALNDTLASYGAEIVHYKGKGYQFEINDQARFAQLDKQDKSGKKVPHSPKERIVHLTMRLLLQQDECKLDDLANTWFVSRTSLQADMVEVREILNQYDLIIESKAYHGLAVVGKEQAIRACIAHVLFEFQHDDQALSEVYQQYFPNSDAQQLREHILTLIIQHDIHLTDEGIHHLVLYCSIALHRISQHHLIDEFCAPVISQEAHLTGKALAHLVSRLLEQELSKSELDYLCLQIAARRVIGANTSYLDKRSEPFQLIDYLLNYINQHYSYDLRNDDKLKQDLLSHVTTMLLRVKFQITLHNPLVDHIKRYYPLAHDITVAAMTQWGMYTIPAAELGYLVMHIGVGLERNYAQDAQYVPSAILVCNLSMSLQRLVGSQLKRALPQLEISQSISTREYESLDQISADVVITTERLANKNKPVLTVSPVPTPFQIDQISKHILTYRTPPYILDSFFDARYFKVLDKKMSQADLIQLLSQELAHDGVVPEGFAEAVMEREKITSTMLGDGIAIPHTVGLIANQTKVYTVFAPKGIDWGNGNIAQVIFLFAIKKEDYEEAMGLYELFVTFMDSKAVPALLTCRGFASFIHFAKQCWLKCKKEW